MTISLSRLTSAVSAGRRSSGLKGNRFLKESRTLSLGRQGIRSFALPLAGSFLCFTVWRRRREGESDAVERSGAKIDSGANCPLLLLAHQQRRRVFVRRLVFARASLERGRKESGAGGQSVVCARRARNKREKVRPVVQSASRLVGGGAITGATIIDTCERAQEGRVVTFCVCAKRALFGATSASRGFISTRRCENKRASYAGRRLSCAKPEKALEIGPT